MTKQKLLIIIIPIAVLFMATIVFFALWLSRGAPDYANAAGNVREILDRESAITEFISDNTSFNYEKIDRDRLARYQSAATQITSYYESLGAGTAINDPEVAAKYNNLAPLIVKLTEISTASNLLLAYTDKANQSGYTAAATELANLKGSPNSFISTLGTDLSNHFAAVTAFDTKYKTGKTSDYNAMIEQYSQLVIASQTLTAKYANTSFEDIFATPPEALKANFDQFRDLGSYLKGKL